MMFYLSVEKTAFPVLDVRQLQRFVVFRECQHALPRCPGAAVALQYSEGFTYRKSGRVARKPAIDREAQADRFELGRSELAELAALLDVHEAGRVDLAGHSPELLTDVRTAL